MEKYNSRKLINMNYSPLRYPGGKSKITPLVKLIIEKANINNCTYIEPFAGGAGVAVSLLISGVVNDIVINDYDKAIYSIWRAIKEDTDNFIELIYNTPISIDEWHRQKEVYSKQTNRYSLEFAFSAFYLNRTNRSGILSAGPIGGYKQNGNYLINARFNREDLIRRIQLISQHKAHITVYNKDVRSFITNYIDRYENAFVYLDPPYYQKGKQLYKNYFTNIDHEQIMQLVERLQCPWMVTYDNVPEIIELYQNHEHKKFDLSYSVANNGTSTEIMFLSNNSLWPTEKELEDRNIKINLR